MADMGTPVGSLFSTSVSLLPFYRQNVCMYRMVYYVIYFINKVLLNIEIVFESFFSSLPYLIVL